MLAKRRPIVVQKCARCGGPMYRTYAQEYCCLYCGEYVFVDAQRNQTQPTPDPERAPYRRRHGTAA
jgi:hypothetical protein